MANTSTLKKIVAEAKRIQKAHPHMEWKNAIKDASKHIKKGAKTVIKKKTTKKGVGYADDRIELLRKTTPILRKLKNEGLTRTKAIKKINKSTKGIGEMPSYQDPDMAREIELYADNNGILYHRRRKPIILNLYKKFLRGTYDVDKAAKLWKYYIDDALKMYHKEFGTPRTKWNKMMSISDRKLLAHDYAVRTLEEFKVSGSPY